MQVVCSTCQSPAPKLRSRQVSRMACGDGSHVAAQNSAMRGSSMPTQSKNWK